MSLSYFSAETMIAVSKPWLDPDRDRPVIESYPELSGSLTMIERGHNKVLSTQVVEGEISQQIEDLTVEMDVLDQEHDRNARITYTFLEGLAERATDPAETVKWNEIIKALFPRALSIVKASYLDQAGGVDKVQARLTPQMRQTLDTTMIDGEPLGETVDRWFEAGTALGDAYVERSQLKSVEDGQRVTAGDVREARHFWMEAVRNFRSMLAMVDMDEDERRRLLTPLRKEQEAAKRRRQKDRDDDEQPIEDPA